MIKTTVSGYQATVKGIKADCERTVEKIIRAVQENTAEMESYAKGIAPVDTGRLRFSIKKEYDPVTNFEAVKKAGYISGMISSPVENKYGFNYGLPQEFGPKVGWHYKYTPHIGPAWRRQEPKFAKQVEKAVKNE